MTARSQSSIDADIDISADCAIAAILPATGNVATDRAIRSANMVRQMFIANHD